ncbi:unnamed protein product [Dracunculus medinensis]|uniref:protein-L-isoaspartate(D-aspartate) O-methyltransferase n=1 Tax=Dracunculus medinensis TaxID=318479 RepID=A0A0N4U0H3_DRAME|nr:unnamed protein product [Dracunculus medinensis]
MLAVDRGDFAPTHSYGDYPVSIGYGATISAPHMHAFALELLKDHLKEGDKALDVGSGSGYLTACMAIMVGKTGKVVGIDHIDELVNLSRHNINKHHGDLLSENRIILVVGDGRKGYEAEAPYKAIHLIDQLAIGGRMFIPTGHENGVQRLMQVDKDEQSQIKTMPLIGVRYVPLTDYASQLRVKVFDENA